MVSCLCIKRNLYITMYVRADMSIEICLTAASNNTSTIETSPPHPSSRRRIAQRWSIRLEDFASAPPAAPNLPITPARQASSERSAVAVIQTMKDLKRLKDGGVIDTPEFKKLKSKALEDLE